MKREILELKQKLMQRFLDNAIDQETYERLFMDIENMSREAEEIESASQPREILSFGKESPLPPVAQTQMVQTLSTQTLPTQMLPAQVLPPHGVPAQTSVGTQGSPTPVLMLKPDAIEVRTEGGIKSVQKFEEDISEQYVLCPEISPALLKNLKPGECLDIWWRHEITPQCVKVWSEAGVPLRLSLNMNEYVDNDSLARLAEVPNIWELNLTSTRITDEGVRHLAPLTRLKSLALMSTEVDGSSLRHLTNCRDLSELTLTSTPFNDDGMEILGAFQSLELLRLDDTDITDEGMVVLDQLHQIAILNLQGSLVSDVGLRHIAHLNGLLELYVGGTIPIDRTVYESPISDKGLVHLKNLTEMRILHLNDTQITDAGVASLKNMKFLRELNVADTFLTDACLGQLKKLTALREIMVENTAITASGIRKVFGRSHEERFHGGRISAWTKFRRFLASPWSRKN